MEFNNKWKEYILYELADWKNGLAFKDIYFSSKGKPVIKIAELKNGITEQTKFTEGDYGEEVYLRKNDLIFSWSGNPKTSIDAFLYDLPDGYLNQHSFKITEKKEIINKYFLYYILKYLNPLFQSIATDKQTTGLGHVTVADLKKIKVRVPTLQEQNKFLDIIKNIDDKIYTNNKINDNLHELAEQQFIKIYNSGNEKTLGNLLDNISTGSRPKGGAQSIGIPSVGAEKIEKFGVYDYSSEKFISEDFYKKLKNGKMKSGDVLLYKDGAYTGKVSMCLNGFPHKESAVNEHVFILNTKDNWAQNYLYFTLYNKENKEMLEKLAGSKAAQPGLNQGELKSLKIKICAKEIIENFEANVKPIMENIANNSLENKKLAELRDTLLPKLMNGEIELDKIIL